MISSSGIKISSDDKKIFKKFDINKKTCSREKKFKDKEGLIDLLDLFCIIGKYKKVALIYITEDYEKENYNLKESVIKYAKESGVKFFKKMNYQKGLHLVIASYPDKKSLELASLLTFIMLEAIDNIGSPYLFGTLLGYTQKSIKKFYGKEDYHKYEYDKGEFKEIMRNLEHIGAYYKYIHEFK